MVHRGGGSRGGAPWWWQSWWCTEVAVVLVEHRGGSSTLTSRQRAGAWSPGKVGTGRALGCRGSSGFPAFPDGAPPNGTFVEGPSGPRSVGPRQETLDFCYPPMGRPRDPVSAFGGPWFALASRHHGTLRANLCCLLRQEAGASPIQEILDILGVRTNKLCFFHY